MMKGLWGKKIGMTQVFSNNKVIPVTVIDVAHWFITQIKTKDKDGYTAVQVGCVKDRFAGQAFSAEWLRAPKKYFSVLREVALAEDATVQAVGEIADVAAILGQGDLVDVTGVTIGRGFQGGVKRHGFTGGRASHGDKLGRKPGSLAGFRRQGRVPKGKRMPGHMGVDQRVMKNLEVVKVDQQAKVLLVKGSVPGKSGLFVYINKAKA